MKTLHCSATLGCLFLATATSALAASAASDNAANGYPTSYDSYNYGTGFSAFAATNTGNAYNFIGTSTTNGAGNSSLGIDTSGKSFGLHAAVFTSATATRSFTAGGPSGTTTLDAGQRFTIQFDNGTVDTGIAASVGLNLLNSSNTARFTFLYNPDMNSADYLYNLGNATNIDTGVAFTPNGLTLSLTMGPANVFTFSILPAGGVATLLTGTLAASDISQFQVFENGTNGGNNTRGDVFFNNPTVANVVPEPSSSVAVASLSALGCLLFFRRRRQQQRMA